MVCEVCRTGPGGVTETGALWAVKEQRATQAAIDLAMHVVAMKHLGMPQSQADAFRLLADAEALERNLSERMTGMCGFRNILIHQYQELEVDILHQVATERWQDLVALCQALGLKIVVE